MKVFSLVRLVGVRAYDLANIDLVKAKLEEMRREYRQAVGCEPDIIHLELQSHAQCTSFDLALEQANALRAAGYWAELEMAFPPYPFHPGVYVRVHFGVIHTNGTKECRLGTRELHMDGSISHYVTP